MPAPSPRDPPALSPLQQPGRSSSVSPSVSVSPPPPSASAAASARRETRPQIARRHPAPRIVSPGTPQPTTQARHIPIPARTPPLLCPTTGTRAPGAASATAVPAPVLRVPAGILRAHSLAMHKCIDAHARWASVRDAAMLAWTLDAAPSASTARRRARQRRGGKHQDGNTLACAEHQHEHQQRIASSTHKRPHRRPAPELRPIDGEEQRERGGHSCASANHASSPHRSSSKACEARDGGAAHVERESAEDKRGGDVRALELGARRPGGLARRPARARGGRTLPVRVPLPLPLVLLLLAWGRKRKEVQQK
ncbi:hypothetical protein DFH09DRAFT_1332290 [Mycena vulgaris]|nr:hypothetical protein DFH09DRAFT_1332290 [Mycena vulgaris]